MRVIFGDTRSPPDTVSHWAGVAVWNFGVEKGYGIGLGLVPAWVLLRRAGE